MNKIMVKDISNSECKESPKPIGFLEWLFYPLIDSVRSSEPVYIRGVYGFY